MKNRTKTPSYQKLPTVEGLASRRGQTVQQLLHQNGVLDVEGMIRWLHGENLSSENDPASYFTPKGNNAKKVNVASEVVPTEVDVAVTNSVAATPKKEGKKVRKDRHTYDADEDRGTPGADELADDKV